MRIDRERKRRRNKRILYGVLTAIGVLLVLGVGAGLVWAKIVSDNMKPVVNRIYQSPAQMGLTKAEPQKPFTILLMGADYRKGDVAYRADSIVLAKIDPQQKKVWILSIPRDMRAEVPGYGIQKINAAHTFGGIKGTVAAVEKLTGVKVNHYMEVNFRGFTQVIDALGGVWINVPVTINDWAAASGSLHHRARHIDAGYQLLDGEHALTFVRARHQFADQDFARMRNQQLFFKALAKQMAQTGNIVRFPIIISRVSRYVQTDLSLGDLVSTALALKDAGSDNIYTASITGVWRTPYVYPNNTQIATLVAKMKAGVPFKAPKKKPAASGVATGTASAVKPSSVTLTIRNGAGVSGLAAQCATILSTRGFVVKTKGNASQAIYPKTFVIYKPGKQSKAQAVANVLPFATMVPSAGKYAFSTDVLVVVGKDWVANSSNLAPVQIKTTQ